MSDRTTELVREEDRGWAELCSLLGRLSDHDMQLPAQANGWSVKDVLGHLASWWAEAGRELERIRGGTYEAEKRDVDQMNSEFFDAMKDLELDTIRAELAASRNKALEELGGLPELTAPAHEWFYESGPCHYDEHLPELRAFVESLEPR